MGLLNGSDRRELAPRPAPRAVLERFHTPRYLDTLADAAAGHMDHTGLFMGLGTPDCPVFKDLYAYATLACGATLLGAEQILGGAPVAFNPSGGYHHAHRERATGFCYLNDVALACMVLADRCTRVMFLDIDVHHGDGVQEAFYARRDVMTVSFHETGKTLFPGTGSPNESGADAGCGFSVNVPLPPHTYDEAFLRAFEAVAVPLLDTYAPEVIVLEIGADMLAGDPLAHMSLTNNVYVDVVQQLLACGIPLLVTGGGGYNVENTARAWALVWATLCGDSGDDHMMAGIGGVMLESTDWLGGLRDRVRAPDETQRTAVDAAVDQSIAAVKATVFPHHGLPAE